MLSGAFNTLLFGVSFIAVLSALVFFHELGHYSVARMFKVAVDRFSIGFGKPIAKWKAKSGTEWSIGRFPLGGYVKFTGDAGAASNPDRDELERIRLSIETSDDSIAVEDCFHFKPLWQRFLIVLAGPMANFILAILIFAGLALWLGAPELKSVVTSVQEGGAAEAADVQIGDHFLTLNGHDVSHGNDLATYVSLRSGETLQATVDRDGQLVSFLITPKRKSREDFIGGKNAIGTIGVGMGGAENYSVRKFGPLGALGHGTREVKNTIAATGTYIGRIFKGRENGSALGGPVRIATITGKSAIDAAATDLPLRQKLKAIIVTLLSIGAALSIGLGVANLMPIPVLDGGHLLYYGYEAVAGRPLSERKQEFGFKIGLSFLLTLFVILTWNDIGYVRSFFS